MRHWWQRIRSRWQQPEVALPALSLHAVDPGCEIELVREFEHERAELEAFVREIFQRHHGAEVRHFLPQLLGLRNDHALRAVLGFAPGGVAPMFLEQYFDQPIEHVVAACVGEPVVRTRIMEVGNLAVASAGGARSLITALTAYLRGAGYDWVVFTAGRGLQNSFARMGIELQVLGPALPERLQEGSAHWGRYYAQNPQVFLGSVAQGYGALQSTLQDGRSLPLLESVWNRAYAAGYGQRISEAA
ncbi:MAG: thermostable hemolysin [Gammaproteobacteria bacterium]